MFLHIFFSVYTITCTFNFCIALNFGECISLHTWRRKWPPTPVLLLREFHGQRSLAGYSPGGCKESDKTERLTLH